MNKSQKFYLVSITIVIAVHTFLLSLGLVGNDTNISIGKVEIKLLSVQTESEARKNKKRSPEKQSNKQIGNEEINSKSISNKEFNQYLDKFIKHLDNFVSYPSMSKRLKEEGYIDVQFNFLEGGRVNYRIIRASEHLRLNESVEVGISDSRPFPTAPKEFSYTSFVHRFWFQL